MQNNPKEETLSKVQKAINKLKKKEEKFSISQIAKEVGIERKTIYNNQSLLERCKQAIELQQLKLIGEENKADLLTQKSKRQNTLEERYKKLKEDLKQEREKNSKLLYQNRELVLENHNLRSKIQYLENQKNNSKNIKLIKDRK